VPQRGAANQVRLVAVPCCRSVRPRGYELVVVGGLVRRVGEFCHLFTPVALLYEFMNFLWRYEPTRAGVFPARETHEAGSRAIYFPSELVFMIHTPLFSEYHL
jgi:hypothetical protein